MRGMNKLPAEKRAAILTLLCEGSSLRAASRIADVSLDTVTKLLVDPAFRRRGIGRALMLRVEQAARGIGRRLLVLDTRAGDDGERLYRSLGWQEAGIIPGYAMEAGGGLSDTVLFWKRP